MKIILILFFLLPSICFAEEFVKDKFNSKELVKEIEIATGFILTGQNQQGYMNTANDTIEVKLKDRNLTDEEKAVIRDIIEKHNKDKFATNKKLVRDNKEKALKTKLGLTDKDFADLKEVLSD